MGRPGRASWSLVLRLARRDIARHRARGLLVVLLIALPVAIVSGLGVLWTFARTTPEDTAQLQMGDADVVVEPMAHWDGSCRQSDLSIDDCEGDATQVSAGDAARQREAMASVRLPGVTLVPVTTAQVTADWKGLAVPATVTAADQFRMRTMRIELPAGATAMPGSTQQGSASAAAGQVWIDAGTAQRYGWGAGSRVRIGGDEYRVSGVVRADGVAGPQIWVGPGHRLAAGGRTVWYGAGATPSRATVDRLNAEGLGVTERAAVMNLKTDQGDGTVIALTLAIGVLAAMVTATIAGAAFAIGARQQRRTLALLGATGADRRVLVRLMASQGVLLGIAGAILGAVAGVGLGNGVAARLNATSTTYPEPHGVPWTAVGAAVAIGVVAATVAAWLPARTVARQDVLAGVRSAGTASPPARFPWAGLVLVALGAAMGITAAVLFRRSHPDPGDVAGSEQLYVPMIGCIVLVFAGVLAGLSWILARAARPAHGGLHTIRFALRDLSRNRGRGTSVIAASMAVTALFSAGLTVMASQDAAIVRSYVPRYPGHVAVLDGQGDGQAPLSGAQADAQVTAVEDELGPVGRVRERTLMRCHPVVDGSVGAGSVGDGASQGCEQAMTVMVRTSAIGRAMPADPDAAGSYSYDARPLMVDDGSLYRLLTGHGPDARVRAAMDKGVVVFDGRFAPHRTTTVELQQGSGENLTTSRTVVPALVDAGATGTSLPALTSPARAARLAGVAPSRLGLRQGRTWLRLPAVADQGRADRINAAIARTTGVQDAFGYEAGPDRSALAIMRWGTLAGAVASLAVAVVVLALSLSDSGAARSAMATIGASAGTLKGIAAVQALVTVGLGSVLGTIVGAAPMALAIWGSGPSMVLAVPWGHLAVLALGVPIVMGAAVRFLVPAARPRLRRRD